MLFNDEGKILLSSQAVQLKPYKPRPFKTIEIISDSELLANVGQFAFVDVECYKNYFLIGFKFQNGKYLSLEFPFNERQLSWIMHNYKTVGFNSIKYDLLMIWYAFQNKSPEELQELSNTIIFQNVFPKQAEIDFQFKVFPTSHIDLIEVAPLRGSLKLYGARLHATRIQELPYSIEKFLNDEEINVVRHYNYNDLDVTELMFNNLAEQLKLRADLSVQYKTNLMSKSDAQIAEAVIGTEIKNITGAWPKKPEIDTKLFYQFKTPNNLFFQTDYMKNILKLITDTKFSVDENGRLERPKEISNLTIKMGNSVYRMGVGGLHSSEETRVIKTDKNQVIIDRDVASYYPRIILNLELYPDHLGRNFLTVYKKLVDSRLDDKKAQRIAQAECKKIAINGTFGKKGNPYSILRDLNGIVQILLGGQLYLLMLIEYLELNQIPVVSANTDGIVILCPHDKRPLMNEIFKNWEQITQFETEETEYEAVYSRDVNAYLAVKRKGDSCEFKGKNDYYDPWRGKSAKDGYWRFQKNPTHQICVEAIECLISKATPIEETIISCKDITKFVVVRNVTGGAHKDGEYLGKTIRWIYAKNITGTINYIKTNNKVPDSEGALPMMDLPEIFPENIDYQRYIAITTEMLEDCGYIARQKQLTFF